jgi:hypothetical protein
MCRAGRQARRVAGGTVVAADAQQQGRAGLCSRDHTGHVGSIRAAACSVRPWVRHGLGRCPAEAASPHVRMSIS